MKIVENNLISSLRTSLRSASSLCGEPGSGRIRLLWLWRRIFSTEMTCFSFSAIWSRGSHLWRVTVRGGLEISRSMRYCPSKPSANKCGAQMAENRNTDVNFMLVEPAPGTLYQEWNERYQGKFRQQERASCKSSDWQKLWSANPMMFGKTLWQLQAESMLQEIDSDST
jgi:hypothetical protein